MDPVLGGILGGGLVGGLDLFGGLLNNQASAAEAARNRRFIAAMYKKRYQFTTADMRKAGLNPVLAATNAGSVGSVPSPGGLPSFDNAFGSAAHSAMAAVQGIASIHKTEADSKYAEANTQLAQGKKIEQDIRNQELPRSVRAQAFKAEAEASLANSASVIQRSRAQYANELAFREMQGMSLRNENEQERLLQNNYKTFNAIQDYGMRPKGEEAVFWDRLDRVSKAVGRGVNSALGLGKLKALSRAFR